jgi:hypothetical protein
MNMSPLAHHMVRLFALFGLLFVVGLVAALRERRSKKKRSELPR